MTRREAHSRIRAALRPPGASPGRAAQLGLVLQPDVVLAEQVPFGVPQLRPSARFQAQQLLAVLLAVPSFEEISSASASSGATLASRPAPL